VCINGLVPRVFAAALAFLPLLPIAAEAQPPDQSASAEPAPIPAEIAGEPAVTIKMSDDDPMYQPPSLVIQAGQMVQWKNYGMVSHSVTDDPTKATKPEDSLLPRSARSFFSGNVMPGGVYRHTFLIPGRYRYFCLTHEVDKMIGEIIVQPPGGAPPAHPGVLGREGIPGPPSISLGIPIPSPMATPAHKPSFRSEPWRKMERIVEHPATTDDEDDND
jgi:plastocyanin